jgi:hypothetical protein
LTLWRLAIVALLAAAVAGCTSGTVVHTDDVDAGRIPTAAVEPTEPPPSIRGLTFDPPADPTDHRQAVASAAKSLSAEASALYEYPDDCLPWLPGTLAQLVRQTKSTLVPAYEYAGKPTTATSLFSVTRPASREYIWLLTSQDKLLADTDWTWHEPPGAWISFGGFGGAAVLGVVRQLRAHFGDAPFAVRFVRVPRGCWVVGRNGTDERGAFMPSGLYDDDPGPRLYTVDEILEYGALDEGGQ